jgi:hypothetical protein
MYSTRVRTTRRWFVAAAAAVVAVLVVLIAIQAEGPETLDPADAGSKTPATASDPTPSTPVRSEPSGTVELTFEVTTDEATASGSALVRHDTHPARLHHWLAQQVATYGPQDGGVEFSASGPLVVQQPRGSATSVVFRAGDVVRPVRVPAQEKATTIRVDLSSDAMRQVLVLVVDGRTHEPVPGAVVGCLWHDTGDTHSTPPSVTPGDTVGVRAPPRSTAEGATLTCDQDGVATFMAPGPGALLLRAPGARIDEGSPHSARVIVMDGGPSTIAVTLIAPEPRQQVRFVVQGDGLEDPRGAGMLFVRRVAGGPSYERPMPKALQRGRHELDLELPTGTFVVDVLPTGRFQVSGDTLFEVVETEDSASADAPQRVEVAVLDRPETCSVRLVGVPIQHHPLRVYARQDGGRHVDRPDVPFLGPRRWGPAAMKTPAIPGVVRLVGIGTSECFLSKPVELTRAEVEVPMEPASLVSVVWSGWTETDEPRGGIPANATLSVRVGSEVFLAGFRPHLSVVGRVPSPTWCADLVVPRPVADPRVFLECIDEEGRTLWSDEVELIAPRIPVFVGFDAG